MFQQPTYCSMPSFVESYSPLLFFLNYFILLFQSADYTIHGIQKVLLLNRFFILTSSNQCCLVTYIGNICS